MNKLLHNKFLLFFIGAFLILLYYVPILISGENWYIVIHDNLDSSIANIKMLKDLNMVFDYSSQEPVIGPVSRSAFRAPWDITILLYTFLPVFWGIVINNLLVRIIAFCGMYLLLSRYVLNDSPYKHFIAVLSALCFAFIAFYSDYGLSAMGIPLVAYAFLNLKNSHNITISLFCIFLFGIYSNLVLSGVFLGIILCLYYLYIVYRDKKIYGKFLVGLILLGLVYLCTNIQLVEDFFGGQINLSHRSEFLNDDTLIDILIAHIKMFFMTQIHTGELITLPILLYGLYCYISTKETDKSSLLLLLSIIAIILFSLLYCISLKYAKQGSFLQQFQCNRFYFLLPSIWIILFARMADLVSGHRYAVITLLITCCVIISCDFARNKEYMFQVKKLVFQKQTEPTYQQFFDTKLFSQIEAYIGDSKQNYQTASIGLYPAVAQYNGFKCIDGYWNSYPLEYKHNFRKIIASELNKSDELKNYFDHWGSRCYIFSAELGKEYRYGKNCGKAIQKLDINTDQFREMGCRYIFSAVPILNYEELGWSFEKSFSTDQSFWKIYLYRIP